jgi:hypothetical protein
MVTGLADLEVEVVDEPALGPRDLNHQSMNGRLTNCACFIDNQDYKNKVRA